MSDLDSVLKKLPKPQTVLTGFTVMLGEVEFMDPHVDDVDFEIEELRTTNSVRYTILADSPLYCFHGKTKCFLPDVSGEEVKQWAKDEIQKDYGNCRVTFA